MMEIGLWGCGSMGRVLAQALAATGTARLAMTYDLQPKAAADLASEYGADTAGSAEELLAYRGLQGVIVALPSYLHAGAAIRAAAAGLDILVEKPMALDVSGCREMLDAARRDGFLFVKINIRRIGEKWRKSM